MVIEKDTEEIIDPKVEDKPIDAEIGDVITSEDGELQIVEAADDDPTKSKDADTDTDDIDIEAEDVDPTKSKEDIVDEPEVKPEVKSTEMIFLEKRVEEQDKLIAKMNLSPEDVLKRTTLKELEDDMPRQKQLLDEIDAELSPTEHAVQKKVVDGLQTAINAKIESARIDERFNSADNKEFLTKERKELEDRGFKYSDENWKLITDMSDKYLADGKYTKEAIQKGLIDIIGADAVTKMNLVSSEQKVRKDIKIAAGKVTKSVNIISTGVSGKLSSFTERISKMTDQAQIEKMLSTLSPKQFAIYEKELEKITNI